MGKRYGRNQKRRARERIAQLQLACTRDAGLLKYMADKARDLEGQIANLADALGVNYVGLPAREIAMKVSDLKFGDSFRYLAPNNAVASAHLMHVDAEHDERLSVHFRVRLGPGYVAYAVSSQALMSSPARFLARRMADEMAPTLLGEIRKLGFAHD